MRCVSALVWACVLTFSTHAALATECDHPNALGVSRTLTVDPSIPARFGKMQYPDTLPLEDHEVVLTFDDGPLPRYTNAILDILASECVSATFFMVGEMAHEFPATARRVAAEGHTIGTHSQNHPLTFQRMPLESARAEIDEGFASVEAAVGDAGKVAPFFRIPGLLRQPSVEDYLASRHIVTFSSDVVGDDWKHHIRPADIVKRTLQRLEAKGRGIILLHDIHAVTVKALPVLLHELKSRGYRVVRVTPAPTETIPPAKPASPPEDDNSDAPPAFWARTEIIKTGFAPALSKEPLAGLRAAD